MTIEVPFPPTTEDQARAWVYWAESEIGVGWHPDTSVEELVTFNRVSSEGRCMVCGETYVPNSDLDIMHNLREDGEECGGAGVITGDWGTTTQLFTGERAKRYAAGLDAAHALLPDIYATSVEILRDLHPEVFESFFEIPRSVSCEGGDC